MAKNSTENTETTTDVRILGGRYTIKSGYDSDFVQRTATLVNERMNAIIQEGGVISTDKVAILASMNIASELLELREDYTNVKSSMKKKLEKVLRTLDTVLSQTEDKETKGLEDHL